MRAAAAAIPVFAMLLSGGEAGGARPGADGQPAATATGRGAAGVTEVGRRMDVVRGRAEREARERAVADLISALGSVKPKQGGPTGAEIEERARAEARDPSRWDLGYWSNGAVTARITVPVAALIAPPAAGKD